MSFVIHVSAVIEYQGRIAFIQEAKEIARGKWNLPGGHLEVGEELLAGALRESHEETGLTPTIASLLGVYTGLVEKHILRFVFRGTTDNPLMRPVAPEEVLSTEWFLPDDILAMQDKALRGPLHLRAIIRDHMSGKSIPLDAISEFL